MIKALEIAEKLGLFRWKGQGGKGYEWDCDPEKLYAFADAIVRHCLYSCDMAGADPVNPEIDNYHEGVKQCMAEIIYQFGLGSLSDYYDSVNVSKKK